MSPQKQKPQVFHDARGRILVERRGLPSGFRELLKTDAYHLMRTSSWGAVTIAFFALFVAINVVFAVVLYAGGARIGNAHGFVDDFWFSVQTLGTIGYGTLTPEDTLANIVVTIESFVGMVLTALITGVVFARFSTPTARIIFSKVAVIGDHDGKRVLMFRMGNARTTAIVESTIRVYVTRNETLASGEQVRRIYDLAMRRSTSPIFNLSWVVYHDIDAASPLFGCTVEDMTARGMNILVTFQGIDDRLAATVHTRYAYNPDDLRFDHRFVDIFAVDPDTGRRYLDFAPFDQTVPVTASARDPAAAG
jgi:inward rectifier potassium channel